MSLHAHVVVRRGSFELDVEFSVRDGEILAVLGPNGAGKTTLLRALAGLEWLQDGWIRHDDDVVASGHGPQRAAEQRRTAFVFQEYRLFPHLSARDNVGFGLRAAGAPRREARRTAQDWLRRLDIAEMADRRPGQLSGGQMQRVALARALAINPDLVLLDEPLAALDAATRPLVRALLRRELLATDAPSVLVTHEALEAMVLADRLLVLEDGRSVQEGTPAEVARRPATPYVAKLMGLNLLAGRAAPDGVVTLDAGGRLITAPHTVLEKGSRRVLVAVRPSSISVHADVPGPGSARNVWPARILGLELLHDRVRLQTEATADGPDVLVDLTAAAVAELDVNPGRRIWLSVKATELEMYPEPNTSEPNTAEPTTDEPTAPRRDA